MKRVEKAAIYSAIATAVIAIVKFVVGTAFGSIALVADAIHSFTDIIGSVAVLFGARFSEIKSSTFPYGLYKLENLISLFLALVIFFTGIEILLEAIPALFIQGERIGAIAIAAAAFSLVVSWFLAKYKLKVGQEEHSPSMVSEAKHTQVDTITTAGVLVGVTASFMGFPLLDPVVGILVSLLVFKAGAEIFLDAAKVLLDASLDYKTMKKIEGIAAQQKNVKVKDVTARNSGSYIFVDLKLETGIKDLKKVDKIKRECEQKIKEKIPRIDKIMVDIEFSKKPVLVHAVPLSAKSLRAKIAPEFGSAKWFGIAKIKTETGEVLSKTIIENPYFKAKSRKGILAAEMLVKNKVDVLHTHEEMHKGGAYYALQDNLVEMKKTTAESFQEAMEKISRSVG